jgi:hypothetical protein
MVNTELTKIILLKMLRLKVSKKNRFKRKPFKAASISTETAEA